MTYARGFTVCSSGYISIKNISRENYTNAHLHMYYTIYCIRIGCANDIDNILMVQYYIRFIPLIRTLYVVNQTINDSVLVVLVVPELLISVSLNLFLFIGSCPKLPSYFQYIITSVVQCCTFFRQPIGLHVPVEKNQWDMGPVDMGPD